MLLLKSGCSTTHRSSLPFLKPIFSLPSLRFASRCLSSFGPDTFSKVIANPMSKHQIYISHTSDPYVNLSIEHFLLQQSPANSTILFLYVNSPCVVIGRNQNPWLEANLRKIEDKPAIKHQEGQEQIQLVRRRSGGGTVFHDHGNANYCVICPTADFSRNKHAEMVTRVLRRQTPRVRVNERHDIVIDQDSLQEYDQPDFNDMYRTGYHREGNSPPPLKVSGSAFKLTRQRSLHHGTCLLTSWNIDQISDYLRSPARPFLKARGVDSVRSPVGNIHDNVGYESGQIDDFLLRVAETFAELYKLDREPVSGLVDRGKDPSISPDNQFVCGWVGKDVEDIPEIRSGIEELKSLDWIYGQTPQFTVSSHPFEGDERQRPPLPMEFPPSSRVYLKVRAGKVTESHISFSSDPEVSMAEAKIFDEVLTGQSIHKIQNFGQNIAKVDCHENSTAKAAVSSWLNMIFGKKSNLWALKSEI